MEAYKNNMGELIYERYTSGLILTDPFFENRLRTFDPNLRLLFDQVKKRWTIVEKALDGSPTFNVLIVCSEKDGSPKPLGEWIFNKLYVWRENDRRKRRLGVDRFFAELSYEADEWKRKREEKLSDDTQHRILDNINQWRRGAYQLENKPVSDVTAGYPKQKGK